MYKLLNYILLNRFVYKISQQNKAIFNNKWHKMKSRIFLCEPSQLVLVITYLGGRFGLNCPSTFLKIQKFENLKIFKNYRGDLSQKLLEPSM